MPLRPSHDESMVHSCCTLYSASTQPVSMFVPLPLPHTSSVPVRTAPVLSLRQEIPGRVGSVIENDVPEPLVWMVTVPPLMAALPVPSLSETSSYRYSTAPLVASTNTCSRLGDAPRWPATTVSQASRGVPASANTTSRAALTESTVAGC